MPVLTFLLEDEHVAWLRRKKERYGVSMSLVLRDILDDEMGSEARFGETEWIKNEPVMVKKESGAQKAE